MLVLEVEIVGDDDANRPTALKGNRAACSDVTGVHVIWEKTMRGVLLWAVGIPIPVIILLYVFHVI
jgi:hypothetical protein